MTNPCQDPTPEQEAIYERDCEIAALKEQIVEACRIFSDMHYSSVLYPEITEFLDQNESIVKECAK